VLAQTFSEWEGYIINDDPEDGRVADLIARLGDSRLKLHQPMIKRGPAGSFNLAFSASNCEFSTLLEDDNWWEPSFLQTMIARLDASPDVDLVVGNERIWEETPSGDWINTHRTIWSEGPDQLFSTPVDLACGSAKLCNSSMVVRRLGRVPFLTPDDLPVDVTEHFRERYVNHPFLLVHEPLVNYAVTQHTNRQKGGIVWGSYQALLTASCFRSLPPDARAQLARRLVSSEAGCCTPEITSLATTSLFFPEARAIWSCLNWRQRARVLLTWIRRFPSLLCLNKFIHSSTARRHFDFLFNSPFNRSLHQSLNTLGRSL
jgi:hypothetical protein